MSKAHIAALDEGWKQEKEKRRGRVRRSRFERAFGKELPEGTLIEDDEDRPPVDAQLGPVIGFDRWGLER